MAEKKLQFPPDPIFNDYLYTILYNSNISEKRQLKGKYLKASMSERSAKAFIQSASLEEKIYMMATLGHRFFITFVRNDFKTEGLSKILEEFEKDRKPKAFSQILEQGIFVSSDITFNRLLGFVSRSIHHHSFFQDMEMQRQMWTIKKWKKRAFTQRDLQFREMDEGANDMAGFLLSGIISCSYAKGTLGVSDAELQILLYLYTNHHTMVSETHLTDFFRGYLRAAELRKSVRSLHKSGNIDGERKDEWSYTISGRGTRIISEFFKVVFTKLNS